MLVPSGPEGRCVAIRYVSFVLFERPFLLNSPFKDYATVSASVSHCVLVISVVYLPRGSRVGNLLLCFAYGEVILYTRGLVILVALNTVSSFSYSSVTINLKEIELKFELI